MTTAKSGGRTTQRNEADNPRKYTLEPQTIVQIPFSINKDPR